MMNSIDPNHQALPWYFDVISPFAYLQLEWLRRERPDVALAPRPVLLGPILNHIGQLGPAEIPAKRLFTYRYITWRAQELGIRLKFPPRHPFNSLAAMRLIVAAGSTVSATQAVFRHAWMLGGALDDPAELAALGESIGIHDVQSRIADVAVKQALKDATDTAIAAGIYGVPTLRVHGEDYFGQDATGLALGALRDPELLQSGAFADLAAIPVGVTRR